MQCYDISDRIIAVSEYSAEDLASRGIEIDKISVVPNGVDTDTYHPGFSTIEFKWDTTLLYVGPLSERKGLRYLIKSMPDILSDHPDTGLVLVGSGDNERLSLLAESVGVRDHVQFEGFVADEDLPDYYRAADLFVFPSTLEGFGMVLVEAMASGLPVVSTTATAIPEVVGDAGVLVRPKCEDALSEAICNILSEGDLGLWATKSRNHVIDKFTWRKVGDRLCTVYNQVLSCSKQCSDKE